MEKPMANKTFVERVAEVIRSRGEITRCKENGLLDTLSMWLSETNNAAAEIEKIVEEIIEDIPKEYWVDSVTVHLPLAEIRRRLGV